MGKEETEKWLRLAYKTASAVKYLDTHLIGFIFCCCCWVLGFVVVFVLVFQDMVSL